MNLRKVKWRIVRFLVSLVITFLTVHQVHGIGGNGGRESLHLAPRHVGEETAAYIRSLPWWKEERITVTPEEEWWLTLNAYFEARGQGVMGMAAVTFVVLRRVKNATFPNSIIAVIRQGEGRPGCHFSWRCDGLSDEPKDAMALSAARETVRLVLAGKIRDVTGGTVHYLNPFKVQAVKGKLPAFACDEAFVTRVGDHFFYRGKVCEKQVQIARQ